MSFMLCFSNMEIFQYFYIMLGHQSCLKVYCEGVELCTAHAPAVICWNISPETMSTQDLFILLILIEHKLLKSNCVTPNVEMKEMQCKLVKFE